KAFHCTGQLPYLEESVAASMRALELTEEDDPERLNRLFDLGLTLDARYFKDRDLTDANKSIALMKEAIGAAGEKTQPHLIASLLDTLGTALRLNFSRTGDLSDIHESLEAHRRAVSMAPEFDLPDFLGELSTALLFAFNQSGDPRHIDEAVSVVRESVALMKDGDPGLPDRLQEAGSALKHKFNYSDELKDIQEAISYFQKAVDVTPKESSLLALRLADLSNALVTRSTLTGEVLDMDEAIRSKRRAISLLHEGHEDVPICFNNLAMSYRRKFGMDGQMETLEEAIRCQERAIAKAVGRSIGLPVWYAALGHSFHLKFQKTRNESDIDQAVSSTEKALEILPPNHVDIPEREFELGNFLISRSQLTKREDDVKRACEHYKRSALFSHGYTARRVEAARKWADLARTFDIESSLDGYERAIDLISAFVGLEQTQSRRHENIAQISDLSRAAAATAVEADRVTRALEWLERGRCLVWSQLNSLRTPVDNLRLVDEQLAERVVAVSKALETSGSEHGKIRVGNSASLNSSVDLAVEWKDLVSSVRQKPGFEDFLETKVSSMEDLPSRGTVVVINVHETRCDALALRAGWSAPIHISLPKRGSNDFKLVDVLRDLWKSVVHPVLDAIGYLVSRGVGRVKTMLTDVQESDMPQRIWWCPTGPLSFLPLHAAGLFMGERDNAFDYAISSYSPNVNTLAKQMRTQVTTGGKPSRVLVVSQPNTPGHTPLPGTTREVQALRGVLAGGGISHIHLEGKEATIQSCIESLVEYDCVHFACHAFQDPKEPLASGFFLHDGRLELSKIIRNNFQSAEFAFLSACQTSTGDDKLSEEAVHLAAGMVAAGYRGVIATMWSIKDKYAPDVATDFYTELIKPESSSLEGANDGRRTAEALHVAVNGLRSRLGDSEDGLLTWVPYVHFG
ncbi:hypothetical protein FA13DRAFT_1613157, partial [Coprinellus micaceus]